MRMRIKLLLLATCFIYLSFAFVYGNLLQNYSTEKLPSKGQLSVSVDKGKEPKLDTLAQNSFDDLSLKNLAIDLDALPTNADVDQVVVEERKEEKPEVQEEVIPEDSPEKEVVEEKIVEKKEIAPKKRAENVGLEVAAKEAKRIEAEQERVVFNFEDVDLKNVANYVERLFDVTFITDEIINPMSPVGKGLKGNKISFKTQKPLTKQQAWKLFNTFLHMVGLTVVPQADPKTYRIVTSKAAAKFPVPVYIGIEPEKLPDDDAMIRYGYFVKDCPLSTIVNVVNSLKSADSPPVIQLDANNAFIITDSAYNIKVLMKIIKELDRVSMPQTMSILKLHRVEAKYVKDLFNNIVKKDQDTSVAARLFGPKKKPTALYFPTDTKIIVEPRTNSLILLGTVDEIRKIEEFVTKHIDVDISAPYSPLHVYQLKYAAAKDIANIMNNLVKFGQQEGRPGIRGAVRSGDKYFKDMQFTAEDEGNRVIIRGDYDDYLKAKEIIDKLDEPPVQVAIEILILSLDINDLRRIGTQIRNKFKEPNGSRVNFQTSGINLTGTPSPFIPNRTEALGANRLLGDLINLVLNSVAGNTVVSFGTDKFGVWGIFNVFKEIANTQIIANPFLLATNNTKAKVKLGESRRTVSQTITTGGQPVNAFTDYNANLEVLVTPKINSDGMIIMELKVIVDSFVGGSRTSKNTRTVKTVVVSADREILALGGLIKDTIRNSVSGIPVLNKIPILGWLFKNKQKEKVKEDLLILISAQVIEPDGGAEKFTKRHVVEYKNTLAEAREAKTPRDPVDKAFFKYKKHKYKASRLVFKRGKEEEAKIARAKKKEAKAKKRRRRRRSKKSRKEGKKIAEAAIVA